MDYVLHLLIQVSVFAILALGQHLLFNRAGMLFVAQVALFAVGAYGAAIAATMGLSPALALLAGTGLALVVGFPMGFPALRLRDDFLLVASLGFCEIVRSILNNWTQVTGGAAGFMNIPAFSLGPVTLAGPKGMFPVAVAAAALCVTVFYLVERSPFGSLLAAIGEDTEGARGLGKSVRRAKVVTLALAASWAGAAGGLWAFYISYLSPTSFTVWESVLVLAMVIIGGSGRLEGALLGAGVLIIIPEVLRFAGLPMTVAGPVRQILFGAALVLIMRFRPEGLLGTRASHGGSLERA